MISNRSTTYGPDFIGIGAQKTGTTWLHYRLSELPDFSFPPIKEIHYFDRRKKYPSPNYLSETYLRDRIKNLHWVKKSINSLIVELGKFNFDKFIWHYKWFFSDYTDDWYLSLFDSTDKITGEISPSYSILDKSDIRKIYKLIPNVKIIFLIRNPIYRAWSHYRFQLRYNHTQNHTENSIEDILNFFKKDSQEHRSDYIRTIDNYATYFSDDQILIGFFDAIKDDPHNLLSEIVDFLGGEKVHINKSVKIKEKKNISPKMDMPREIEVHLKNKYEQLIKNLAERFGSYCLKWYDDIYGKQKLNLDQLTLKPTILGTEKGYSFHNTENKS